MLVKRLHDSEDTAWVSVDEAARSVGVSRQAVHGWISRGQLAAQRVGNRVQVETRDLHRIHQLRAAAVSAGVHPKTLVRWVTE
jgi:excisionase family DNA binding protein